MRPVCRTDGANCIRKQFYLFVFVSSILAIIYYIGTSLINQQLYLHNFHIKHFKNT